MKMNEYYILLLKFIWFYNIYFFLVLGSKMCLLYYCYGGILDNRSVVYCGDVIVFYNFVFNGWVIKCKRCI